MAIIQRPTKQGGATTFQGKIAQGYTKILASEADADIDTIFAAWNGGADTVNLRDNAVTSAKIAPGAVGARELADGGIGLGEINQTSLAAWVPSGVTITPADATKNVLVQGGTVAVQGGAANPVKTRVLTHPTNFNTYLSNNVDIMAPSQDDATRPSWVVNFGSTGADQFAVRRAPPGSTVLAFPLVLDASGNLAPAASISTGGATVAYWGPGVRITGANAGIRCQSTGTAQGDGYSNAVAFGWNGALTCRVDATNNGTVNTTPPSDARLKRDVREDIPGLAAVLALRPITFEYDQTKRGIGFPPGRLYGLIAQEAHAHVPAAIEDDGSDEHWLALDYRLLVPVLIRAIQELAQKMDAAK